ncbi:hypothetical protein HN011_009384 [Eciton burchellii]|nr:hypothetical protein HN011_009384 [Eciton burchellii]
MRDCRSVEFPKEIDNQSNVSIENRVTMRIAHTFTMHTAPLFIYVLIDYFGQIQIVILHEEVQRGRLEETRPTAHEGIRNAVVFSSCNVMRGKSRNNQETEVCLYFNRE